MNVMNNKRRRESQEKIQKAFIELLQTREIKEISVSALIKTAGLNRSTFYANYIDIFDLADKTREKLESDFSNLFADYDYYNERSGALKMFRHIKENQIFYNTYFKLCYDDSHLISKYDTERAQKEHMDSNLKYHIEFFRNGLDNTIRVQCAAEGDIFRFTALSSLKYSSISASCRLEKTKNLPPLRSRIFAENARRWPRGAQSKTYRGILRTGQQSGRGGHSRKNALYSDCIV